MATITVTGTYTVVAPGTLTTVTTTGTYVVTNPAGVTSVTASGDYVVTERAALYDIHSGVVEPLVVGFIENGGVTWLSPNVP